MTSDPASTVRTQRDYNERLLRVLMHIQQHLDESLDLGELARIACFSPYHFHRIFTGMTGETVKAHIRRLRLERAASQLKNSRLPVTQIALNAGYDTHEAFTRAFKASFGMAPSRFRSDYESTRVLAPSEIHWNRMPCRIRKRNVSKLEMNVIVKSVPPRRVAFMRHVGAYNEVGVAWDRILGLLGKEGLIGGDTMFIGICHDDPEVTPADKIRYDACVTVEDSYRPENKIGVQVLAGGDYAVTTHFGSYDWLNRTYAKLFGEWLPRSGRDLGNRPCFEVYLNSPENTEPEDLVTDIYLPLASIGEL